MCGDLFRCPYTPPRHMLRHNDDIIFTLITQRISLCFISKEFVDFFISAVGGFVTSAMTADVPCLCSEHVFSVFNELSVCKMVGVTS